MASTIYPPSNLGLVKCSEEEEHNYKKLRHVHMPSDLLYVKDSFLSRDNRNSKLAPAYDHFKHNVTKECLCIDGCHNPSWVGEELRRREPVVPTHAQDRELCGKNDNDKALSCRNEVPAFVALLKDCTKNKDLHRGTRVHDDILKRGLLEKCLDA
eukprot:c15675_g1_i1 orf=1-462(-)